MPSRALAWTSGTCQPDCSADTFSFTWCCRWRAEQEGWKDYFGFPDQIRAAREFGWDCFQRWSESAGDVPDVVVPSPRVEGLTA